VGADKAFEIVVNGWGVMDTVMNVKPMISVKQRKPEEIAAALMKSNAKEVAATIRFIDNEKREKVLALMSGENTEEWLDAEKEVEKHLTDLYPDGESK
jgi:hypothetical protein